MSAAGPDFDAFECPLAGVTLIEASAGTGKTFNLSALYLRLLLERDLPVQRLLVVTFTHAATAELRERIRARIVEARRAIGPDGRCVVPPDSVAARAIAAARRRDDVPMAAIVQRLDAAIASFDEAAIHTIHTFCQRALGQVPFAAGLPMRFELLPDDSELLLEAVNDFWRTNVCGDELSDLLVSHLEQARDSPERWVRLLRRRLGKPLASLVWPDAIDALGEPDDGALRAALRQARAHWDATRLARSLADPVAGLHRGRYTPARIESGARSWDDLLAQDDPLARPARWSDADARLFCSTSIEGNTKKGHARLVHPFFDAASRVMASREQLVAQLALKRLALLKRLLETAVCTVRDTKRERRVVSFDDMLSNLHDALGCGRYPWLAGALRERYPVAMIDEFQDTDPVQLEVFERIYRPSHAGGEASPAESSSAALYLVGDPKQAIYGFRSADLHAYLRARERADARFTLRHNQRSSPALLEACNALFGANTEAFILPGMRYEPVRPGEKERSEFVDRSEPGGGAALRAWWLPHDAAGLPPRRADAIRLAVLATAAEIARLVREGRADRILIGGGGLRPASIAVLVRTHQQGRLVKEALGVLGVGSVELSQHSVYASLEAAELERLMLAVLEPSRPGELLAALATDAMGWTSAKIAELRDDEGRMLATMERFDGYRHLWQTRGFGPMLRQWMAAEGVDARLLARVDGERRLTNLLHLAELLHEASSAHRAPDALLRWFSTQRREAAAGEDAQLRLESDEDLVRIVTIHKAKGLEYDVVFCPFLWDGRPEPDSPVDGLEYHAADGTLLVDFRPESGSDPGIEQTRRAERNAEKMRLFYVALTRAVHRCYFVAGCYRHQRDATWQSACSPLNWLAAGNDVASWWGNAARGIEPGSRSPAQLLEAWQSLARRTGGAFEVRDWPRTPALPVPATDADDVALTALPPPASLPAPWWIGSFSRLIAGAGSAALLSALASPASPEPSTSADSIAGDAAAADHDAFADALDSSGWQPKAGAPAVGNDDFMHFPRGPSAGDCMHAAFELADFTDRDSWPDAIGRALARHPQRLAGVDEPTAQARLARMLHSVLDQVSRAALPAGVRLADVPTSQRLSEMSFHLTAGALSSSELNDFTRRHGYAVPRLGFGTLSGYLTGFIDLVFRHEQRWWIADWKSNHLGTSAAAYAGERLRGAMVEHGYLLQSLLYAVALHRWLKTVQRGYDYDRHFGGAIYVFVRGVRDGWTDASGAPAGLYLDRPPRAMLEALDALIAGGT